MKIRSSPDLLSGLLFCALGVVGMVLASEHAMGTPARMGAGFFPMGLSIILLGLGAIVLVQALIQRGASVGNVNPRPLIAVLAGVIVFGLVVERWGFVIAGVVLIFIARLAGGKFHPIEVALLAAGLVALTSGIFVFGLKLPLHLLPV